MKSVTLLWDQGIIGKPVLTAKSVRMVASVMLGERMISPDTDLAPASSLECVMTLHLDGHVLPNNLFKTEIRRYLNTIVISEGITVIDDGAFQNFEGLSSLILPDGLVTIGKRLCSGCTLLNKLHIPATVTTIGAEAFRNCSSLDHVAIPNSVTMIDKQAFMGCTGITNAAIGTAIQTIGAEAFADCSELRTLIVGKSLRELGTAVFRDCVKLAHPELPGTLRTIPNKAFFGCYAIRTVTLPEGVTTLGADAYAYCSNLEEVTLPSTIKTISSRTFSKCICLSRLTIHSTQAPSVGKYIFSKNRRKGFVLVPKGAEGYADWQSVLPVKWSFKYLDPQPEEQAKTDAMDGQPVTETDSWQSIKEDAMRTYNEYIVLCKKIADRFAPFFPWKGGIQVRYIDGIGWILVVLDGDTRLSYRCRLEKVGHLTAPVTLEEFLQFCDPALNRHLD